MTKQPKKMGLWMLTALVAGNMIGSGIFLLPSNLASIGSISLASWGFTACGAILLALVFGKMSRLVPKTGGPYAYAHEGFGKFIGFQTAFNYWVALWVGNAAIAVALVGYLRVFFPVLQNSTYSTFVAIGFVWLVTVVNLLGVHRAGFMQLVTMVLKVIPLLLVCIFGWAYFHPHYIATEVNLTHQNNFLAISTAATLTLWAFIGLESATVPSGSVVNPKRNIPLATILGVSIAAILYVVSSAVMMGMIPAHILSHSTSPFAAAANIIVGPWGRWLVAVGAMISCLGALNGWTLLQGQVPMAAADRGIFPKLFGRRNKHDVPAFSLIITSILITLLLLLTTSPSLVQQFKVIILVATMASLLPYLYTCMAQIIVLKRGGPLKKAKKHVVIAIIAAIYAFWAILGSGEKIVYYGTILLIASVLLYTWTLCQMEESASN